MYQHKSSPVSRAKHRLRTVSVIALLTGLVIAGWWWRAGYHVLSVQSDSMTPYLVQGDVVIVRGDTASLSLHAGEVVSYRSPIAPRLLITHRVVAVDNKSQTFIAKGDKAVVADLPVRQDLVVGKVVAHIPIAGHVLDWLRSPYGLALGVYLPAFVIVGAEFRRLKQHYDGVMYRHRTQVT